MTSHPVTAGAPDHDRAPSRGTLIIVPPPADLAPVIEYVWQLVLPGDAERGAFWRVVVDGYVDLAARVPLTAELLRAASAASASSAARGALADALAGAPHVACGAATAARVIPMPVPLLLTGVRFRLGAAAGVLRNAPAELVDGARPLADVLDARAARDAAGELAAAARHVDGAPGAGAPPGDPEAVVRALARTGAEWVARRLVARAAARGGGPRPADPRVRGALHLLDRVTVDRAALAHRLPARASGAPPDPARHVAAVARALAVSPRTLERLFAEHVGFAPRTYQRLRRVGAVAEALERGGPAARGGRAAPGAATLSALAHGLGYTDHAHMTREFTRAMGVSPSRYRREALEAPVVRRFGAVAFERSTPVGTVGSASAA